MQARSQRGVKIRWGIPFLDLPYSLQTRNKSSYPIALAGRELRNVQDMWLHALDAKRQNLKMVVLISGAIRDRASQKKGH